MRQRENRGRAVGGLPGNAVCGWLLATMLLSMPAGGCSGGRPGVDLVRVSGRITCAGGPMPAAGRLTFVPRHVASGTTGRPLRPAAAIFAPDGVFAATSWTPGDGLVPGSYAVLVDCWDVAPTMGGPPAKSFIAPAYGSAETTPLEVIVAPKSGPLKLSLDVARLQ